MSRHARHSALSLTTSSTCIISILRLQALYAVSHTKDISWENPLAAIYSSMEVNVGIICSCLPTLKGCLQRFFPRLFTSLHTSRGSRSHSHALGLSARRDPDCEIFVTSNRNTTSHERNRSEKRISHGFIYAADGNVLPQGVASYSAAVYADGPDVKRQTVGERDLERRDDASTLRGSDSMRPLIPLPRAYGRP